MKHRLLTLMVAGLFAAGTACAQSNKGQLCDVAKAKQFISQHPELGSSFYMDDASGQMICTNDAVFKQFSEQAGTAKSGQLTLSSDPAGTSQPAKANHALSTVQPNATQVSSAQQQEKEQWSSAKQKEAGQMTGVQQKAVEPSAKQPSSVQQKEGNSDSSVQRAGVDRVTANKNKAARATPARTTTAPATPAASAPKTTVAVTPAFSPEYAPEVGQRLYDLELKMKTDPANADQYRAEYEQLREQRLPTKSRK